MLKLGSKVRVKENAYEGSDVPNDFLARGEMGVIVYLGQDGDIEVQTEDNELLLLTTDEVEEIEGAEAA